MLLNFFDFSKESLSEKQRRTDDYQLLLVARQHNDSPKSLCFFLRELIKELIGIFVVNKHILSSSKQQRTHNPSILSFAVLGLFFLSGLQWSLTYLNLMRH